MNDTTESPRTDFMAQQFKDAEKYCPSHMRGALDSYYNHGIYPGSFLASVLANDFSAAAQHADHINATALKEWGYVLSALPRICWGSPEKVEQWMEMDGMSGIRDRQEHQVTP